GRGRAPGLVLAALRRRGHGRAPGRCPGAQPDPVRRRPRGRRPRLAPGAARPAAAARACRPRPPAGALSVRRAFTVETGGIRLHGFFISPDRATGTLTPALARRGRARRPW